MAQKRYPASQRFLGPGMDYFDEPGEKFTLLNQDPQARQVDEIDVSGSGNANETYEIALDGVTISYQNDGSPTTDELGQGLTDAINNENLVNGKLQASFDAGTDTITITARYAGIGFTYSEVSDPQGVLSQSRTTQNATAAPVPWGRALEKHGALGEKLGRLVDASNYTARLITVTLDGSTDGDYRVKLTYHGGQTFVATYTASGDNQSTILDNLRDDINNNGPDLLSASTSAGPTLDIEPETAGFADYDVVEADGPSQVNDSVTLAGDDINELFGGVAVVSSSQTSDHSSEYGQYDPNDEMDVRAEGAVVTVPVEDQPFTGADVFVRLSANGNRDRLGAFRATQDSGVVPLKGAEFKRAPNSDVAVVKLP